MPEIQHVALPGLLWRPGAQARIWFAQPRTVVSATPPFSSASPSVGLSLLKAILRKEAAHEPMANAPTWILLPELALSPAEIPRLRELVAASRPNTVFVCGVGQLNAAEAHGVEPAADLWSGPAGGHYTNCAVVGMGGRDQLHLQPKIVPSQWERDSHWPGRVIRCFEGDYVAFAVLICSELLARPQETETIALTLDALAKQRVALGALFWLQHNPKPRSHEFSTSIAQLAQGNPVPTAFLACSRQDRPERYEHYAVSGAIIPHAALPESFDQLDAAYRCVEPVPHGIPLARMVFLRYDADVYLVRTSLPSSSATGRPATEKGAVFEQCDPYSIIGTDLEPSPENAHIEDLTAKPLALATGTMPGRSTQIAAFRQLLVDGGTSVFLRFLDVAIPPRPEIATQRHSAGDKHPRGDYGCTCWPHRICVDLLAYQASLIEAVGEVLCAAGALREAGLSAEPCWRRNSRTNTEIALGNRRVPLGIVFPFQCGSHEVEPALRGPGIGGRALDAPYVVLGPRFRPQVAQLDSGRAAPLGAINAARVAPAALRAVFSDEFWRAVDEARVPQLLEDLIAQ